MRYYNKDCPGGNLGEISLCKSKEGKMLKQFAATFACASILALLVGVFHYEPAVGSNVEKAQTQSGQNHKCPPGQVFQGGGCH
jgi:hypothetical protein